MTLFARDVAPGATNCTRGNLGDIWRSTDSGATWTSLRNTNKLPTAASLGGAEYSRMALGAGVSADPATTVVYAQVANADTPKSKQLAVFKSTNGGQSFTTVARDTDAVTSTKLSVNASGGHMLRVPKL